MKLFFLNKYGDLYKNDFILTQINKKILDTKLIKTLPVPGSIYKEII